MANTIEEIADKLRASAARRGTTELECADCGHLAETDQGKEVERLVEHALYDHLGAAGIVLVIRERAIDAPHLAESAGKPALTIAEQKERALLHTCPNCQSRAGQPCTQPDDRGRHSVTTLHSARLDLIP